MNTNRNVVYTAIFGKKDVLHTPQVIPSGWDFVCFTDQPLHSHVWQVRRVTPPETDPTRSARKYKLLPHLFLSEYDTSVWADGNVLLCGNVAELADTYLRTANLAVFDHAASETFPIRTVAEHEKRLLEMEAHGKHQEDAPLIARQAEEYRRAGYPDTQGFAWTLVLLRRHNREDVIAAMEAWWKELSEWTKRDQMSFNYVAWKTGLKFNYIPLDGMDNPYTKRLNHYLPLAQKLRSYALGVRKRIGRLLGTI